MDKMWKCEIVNIRERILYPFSCHYFWIKALVSWSNITFCKCKTTIFNLKSWFFTLHLFSHCNVYIWSCCDACSARNITMVHLSHSVVMGVVFVPTFCHHKRIVNMRLYQADWTLLYDVFVCVKSAYNQQEQNATRIRAEGIVWNRISQEFDCGNLIDGIHLIKLSKYSVAKRIYLLKKFWIGDSRDSAQRLKEYLIWVRFNSVCRVSLDIKVWSKQKNSTIKAVQPMFSLLEMRKIAGKKRWYHRLRTT